MVTDRPTRVVIYFQDGTSQEMTWPHCLCKNRMVTGRIDPVGNLEVNLHRIEPDGTFIYYEVPGTFSPIPMEEA
jgi:hypothetical protein